MERTGNCIICKPKGKTCIRAYVTGEPVVRIEVSKNGGQSLVAGSIEFCKTQKIAGILSKLQNQG